jgi:tRNA modification GTPase
MSYFEKDQDTIIALATPAGISAISVVRMSGKNSFSIIDNFFRGKIKISDAHSHTIHYGKILLGDETIDDVLISVFHTPHSYTGENSVEISTHGNPLIIQKIIEAAVNNGARIAEPGEYTKRAFLNGRIDLSQAEAVADIINSRTEASLKGARSQLDGLLSKKVNSLREALIETASLLELELDFAEEGLEFISMNDIKTKVENIISEIDTLLKTYSFGKVLRDGVHAAIVGRPNVGKSSLLNYLLKDSRAIVSEIPGTTRDIIKDEFTYKGILFHLSDTAGMRLTEDAIEKEGVLRSINAVENADIVLMIGDVIEGFSEKLYKELTSLAAPERIIRVMNKTDLNGKGKAEKGDIGISAHTGEGIENLLEAMYAKAIGTSSFSERSIIVSNIRHFTALKKAKDSLSISIDSLIASLSNEFISFEIRNGAAALSEIIGEVSSEDILNNIFLKFCIGK